jgi:protoporphyrinogen oxidase
LRLVERDTEVGGKARSHREGGYTFDVTGHWLHLRDDRMRALVDELFAPGELVTIARKTGVWTHGAMLAYPFQANLHGLPLPLVQRCLVDLIAAREQLAARAARGEPPRASQSFREFVCERFGEGMAELFFVPYNTKLWGVAPDGITSSWVSRFVPIPDVAQIVGGALGLRQDGLGYNASFTYPRAGGIDHLPRALAAAVEREGLAVELGNELEALDPVGRRLKLARDPEWVAYARVVSTLPLPALVERCTAVPAEVQEAAGALRGVAWRYLDVASRRAPTIPEHWVYVPELELPFFRVGIYSNALPAMAPPGGASLYVELSDRARAPDMAAVVEGLVAMGALQAADDIAFVRCRDVPDAYVVFDAAHAAATAVIHRWLASVGVRSCGRYGGWIYNSMEDSMIEGIAAAQWLMSGDPGSPGPQELDA